MRGASPYGTAVFVLGLIATAAWAGCDGMQDEEVKPPSSFRIPSDRPGQIATIWSWGPDRPYGERALVLTAHGESRQVGVQAPTRVRWRSPTELIVEQFVRPVRNGSGTRVVRMNRQGEILEVLSDRAGLGGSELAPGGGWIALKRYDERGIKGLEVRDLATDFRLQTFHPSDPKAGSPGTVIWSPDASQLAVTLLYPKSPEEPGRLQPRIALASRAKPGFTRLNDTSSDMKPEPGGVVPLFWNEDGIYARSGSLGRGLLRCDPGGSGCTLVYVPGEPRFVLKGRLVGDDKALVLVKDFTVDPLEARAKEIHEVNLATGEGRGLLRLPDGVFISDLDWIADAGDS